MKRMKLPLVTACALVLASNVSFAGGGGSYGASGNTDQQGSVSGTTDSGTTSGTTSGTSSDMSTGTSSGTTTDTTMGTTSGTTSQQQMGSAKSQQTAMKKGENYHVINFSGKSANLTDAQKREIRTLIDTAKQKGEIDQVHVAVWSDKAFPQEGQNLTDAERNLAEQRISGIETYMNEQLQVSNVETYSMAEKTNWFARAFNTNEAELQSLFSQQGAPQNVDPQEFRIVKKEGGANKAVILIEMKGQKASGSQSSSTMGTTQDSSMSNDQQRAPASTGNGMNGGSTTDDSSTGSSGQ